jgi:pimeloyl-ACP methyl ester carboxylesterase
MVHGNPTWGLPVQELHRAASRGRSSRNRARPPRVRRDPTSRATRSSTTCRGMRSGWMRCSSRWIYAVPSSCRRTGAVRSAFTGQQTPLPLEAGRDRVGDEGPRLPPRISRDPLARHLPDAKVTRLDDAGHYLQEDAYERIVPALVRFVSGF